MVGESERERKRERGEKRENEECGEFSVPLSDLIESNDEKKHRVGFKIF